MNQYTLLPNYYFIHHHYHHHHLYHHLHLYHHYHHHDNTYIIGQDSGDVDVNANLSEEEIAQRRRTMLYQRAVLSNNFSNFLAPPFHTPQEWVLSKEFENHVGFDVWGYYKDQGFEEVDDYYWDDDIYMAQCIQHVKLVTDVYLNDHLKVTEVGK